MTDYDEARSKVAHQALKLFNEYGSDRALQMYFGAIDSLVYAALCLNCKSGAKNRKTSFKLVIDNTKGAA